MKKVKVFIEVDGGEVLVDDTETNHKENLKNCDEIYNIKNGMILND